YTFFFSSRRRHTRFSRDWSSDVCSSDLNEDGQVQHIYLLDKALGFEKIGTISPNLAEKIIELSCHKSYRQVAQTIKELTSQTIKIGRASCRERGEIAVVAAKAENEISRH